MDPPCRRNSVIQLTRNNLNSNGELRRTGFRAALLPRRRPSAVAALFTELKRGPGGHVTITLHGLWMACESAIDRKMVGEVFAVNSRVRMADWPTGLRALWQQGSDNLADVDY